MTRLHIRRLLLVALACLAHEQPAAAADAPARPPRERVTLALKWYHQFQFAGYYAAAAKGFYAEEGLEVAIREPVNKRLPLDVVLAGEADYGVSAADLLKARSMGAPIVVLAAIFQHSPIILLSRSDRNIRAPADLVGKRIMVGGNDLPEIQAMLIREGVPLDMLHTVSHTWSLDELVAGTVDAVQCYVTDEPNQLRARGIQPAIMRPIDYGIDFYGDGLFTSEREVRQHPERAAAFRRASIRGWDYAMTHVDEMIALILGMRGVRERGITAEHLRYEAEQMEDLVQSQLVEAGHMNHGRWQRMVDTYKELGLLQPTFSLEGFLYEPVAAARPRRLLHLLTGLAAGMLFVGGLALVWNNQLRASVRRQTNALRESRDYLKNLLDSCNDAIFVHDAATGRVLDVNRRMCELFGCAREDALASSADQFSQGQPPYGAADAAQWMRKARSEGPQMFHWWARRLDGQLFWVDVSIRFVSIGGAERFVVMVRDISERKRVEQELLSSRQSYEDIYNSVSEAIYIHDENGVFLDVNRGAEQMYGYTREELIGKTPADVGAPGRNDLAAVVRVVREVFETGVPGQFEFWAVRKNGEVFPKDVITSRGRYFGRDALITTARDITGLKRAEEERARLQAELTQAQKMESVGRLAGGVAHDFNNMLGVILGRSEMALDKVGETHSAFEDLEEIRKAARRSADLTHQLLAFARKQNVTPRVLDLNGVVGGMLKMLRRLIGENVSLAWRPADGLWPIRMDPVQIDQILANLCVNARDAISGNGWVAIETRNVVLDEEACAQLTGATPGAYVLIAVEDDGCGMDDEVKAHLFEPFFTTKALGQGTGLGLAMVYGIVRQNGGFLAVNSAPKKGTRFHIYLPRHDGSSQADSADAAAPRPVPGRHTILLVEDEVAVLDLCRDILKLQGYRILATSSPAEALRLADAHAGEIDLLLTDVVMPDMNGRELVHRLRLRHPSLKCLFMSGYTADILTNHGVDQKGTPFIEKPFSNADLVAKVQSVLNRAPPQADPA